MAREESKRQKPSFKEQEEAESMKKREKGSQKSISESTEESVSRRA